LHSERKVGLPSEIDKYPAGLLTSTYTISVSEDSNDATFCTVVLLQEVNKLKANNNNKFFMICFRYSKRNLFSEVFYLSSASNNQHFNIK
jgi:hypothetical protein|tara:strand:- start:28 stop:297 length:270 start_codon:yes stop_codon:yes gene_type:complete